VPPVPPDQRSSYGGGAASETLDMAPRPRRFLSRRQQAARYGKSVKTLERWGNDPAMGMPAEYWLGSLPHRDEVELEVWEQARVGAASDAARKGRRLPVSTPTPIRQDPEVKTVAARSLPAPRGSTQR
jgi:hypothetical protein